MDPNPTSGHEERLESLFAAAVELEAESRTSLLDRSCQDAPKLRKEVESLLAAFDSGAPKVRSLFGELPLAKPPGEPSPVDQHEQAGLEGTQVDCYKVLRKLGRGGMGVVYHAYDERLARSVALKFLPEHLVENEKAKSRFILEAQSTSALDHPNICTIYDVGETDEGQLFIVMAYYQGQSLKYRLAEQRMRRDEAVNIVRQVASGLQAAHDVGIVHRDIKPANIMLTRNGLVKILDFGIAKFAWGTDLTSTGMTLGSTHYMSPEQIKGEEVDQRTDLWAIGVLLYEMLSGRNPFDGEYDLAVIYSVLKDDPPPLPSSVPKVLQRVTAKLMQKDPSNRYRTVDEVLRALDGYEV